MATALHSPPFIIRRHNSRAIAIGLGSRARPDLLEEQCRFNALAVDGERLSGVDTDFR